MTYAPASIPRKNQIHIVTIRRKDHGWIPISKLIATAASNVPTKTDQLYTAETQSKLLHARH